MRTRPENTERTGRALHTLRGGGGSGRSGREETTTRWEGGGDAADDLVIFEVACRNGGDRKEVLVDFGSAPGNSHAVCSSDVGVLRAPPFNSERPRSSLLYFPSASLYLVLLAPGSVSALSSRCGDFCERRATR